MERYEEEEDKELEEEEEDKLERREEEEDKEVWFEVVKIRLQALEEEEQPWERAEKHERLYPECTSLDLRDSGEEKSFDLPESPRPLSQETRNLTASELLLNKSVILIILIIILPIIMLIIW